MFENQIMGESPRIVYVYNAATAGDRELLSMMEKYEQCHCGLSFIKADVYKSNGIARHQLGDVVGGAFILFQRTCQREVQVRRRRQVFDPADGAAQARAVQQVAQFFQAVDRLQHGFRRQRQRQEAVRHADQLDRGGQAVVTAFQQRDADGLGTQRADLPQQRGRRQVGQRGPHHHHVDRAVGHREHRRLAVGHRFHGPLVSHVADVIGQIVRQAGGIANVQNAQSTSPCFVQPSTRALLAGHGPDEI